jgi:hypothetical protein
MILTYCGYKGLGKTHFLLNLLVVEAGVEVVVADGVVAVAPLPHNVLIFTPCNALIKLFTPDTMDQEDSLRRAFILNFKSVGMYNFVHCTCLS